MEHCNNNKKNGYIHVFKVKKDIPNIFVMYSKDINSNFDFDKLKNEFCLDNHNYNGLGFFYPKDNIEIFSDTQQIDLSNQTNYYSEFGLCDPGSNLEYLYSQKCVTLKKLSEPFRFA
jgi:hypothetical protein